MIVCKAILSLSELLTRAKKRATLDGMRFRRRMISHIIVKFLPTTIDGSAISNTPTIMIGMESTFPINVVGTMSPKHVYEVRTIVECEPYPVVVKVTTTNQNADGMLSKALHET